jgi:D-alanine-D-alanine ligase
MQQEDRLRVAVLMGGLSGEREVSLKSGKAVVKGLTEAGHEAIPYDVVDPLLPGLRQIAPDVAFVALHGTYGEDGTVQLILEKLGVPYTGSGAEASRLGMDKLATKRLFVRHAISTPDYLAVGAAEDPKAVASQADHFGYPLVCKPSASGSSLGVSIVKKPAQLEAALADARTYGDAVIIERYVPGREFTAGVLDGTGLPLIELIVSREFFDYTAKYKDENTRYVTPMALLPSLYRKASEAAERAYQAMGCRHMARVDMIYGHDGNLYVLEVNTIPGFTPRSLLPMAAAQAGISFPALCDRIARAALRDAAAGAERKRLTA